MRHNHNRSLYEPTYPDVLSKITSGPRINMDLVECLIAVYPRATYLSQPFEVVVVLQSMIDKPLPVKVGVRTPTSIRGDQRVVIKSARPQYSLTMKPGEVGVLRLPMVAQPPTPAVRDLPIQVAVRYKPVKEAERVRPVGGGAPPSVLSVSPFKLQALSEMSFVGHDWNEAPEVITAKLDLAAKSLPEQPKLPDAHYEVLWSLREMKQERELAFSHYDEAVELAKPLGTEPLFPSLLEAVEERFGNRGMALHPAEAAAVAKIMTYTLEDAPERERFNVMENTHWFRALCQVLAARHDELNDMSRADIISQHLFNDLLHDSTMTAFHILESLVDEDLGTQAERDNYAEGIMKWFTGAGEADLAHLYLPLVLGGVAIGHVTGRNWAGNPWYFYEQMYEAYNGRLRLATDSSSVVFDMLVDLLEGYAQRMRYQRVERPSVPYTPERATTTDADLKANAQDKANPGQPPTEPRIRRLRRRDDG